MRLLANLRNTLWPRFESASIDRVRFVPGASRLTDIEDGETGHIKLIA